MKADHEGTPSPGSIVPSAARTFGQLVASAAATYGNEIAITLGVAGIPDESISFLDLNRKSADLARGLLARGVGKGSRIGFIFGNGPMFAVVLAAIARIGAIAVPISTFIKANELVRVLRQSDVAGLIVQRTLLGNDYVDRLCDALPALRAGNSPALRLAETPFLRWIVSAGDDLPSTFHTMGFFTDLAESVSEALLAEIEVEVHPTDQMIEIYTSGSMALPKGVKHTHGAVLFRTHWIRSKIDIGRGQNVPVPMPMFWVGGLMMYLLPNWQAGATTSCAEGTSTSSRFAMGSVLAADDMKAIGGIVPWALGMTETLGPYSYGDVLRVDGYPLAAPLDNIADAFEVRIVDDQGQEVADGIAGEILVRGYPLTPGLHKVERSDYFDPDGFYRTGDMVVVDKGRMQFVGRSGDMIKTVGSNVSPAEVEMEMQQLEGVHSAYVVGLPDHERGQIVVAAVVAREGSELDFAYIQKELRQRLSSYKVPRAYIAISRDEVPMLFSNKVGRRQLEQLVATRLDRPGLGLGINEAALSQFGTIEC